jgi:hypothetical protein
MDLNDIFDKPIVRLKPSAPRHTPVDLAKTPKTPNPPKTSGALDGDLPVKVADVVKAAAAAHDAASEAKAAYDAERCRLQEKMDDSLTALAEASKLAQETSRETRKALEAVMEAEGITNIPMTDRPDVKVKVTKGRKGRITKKWLCDTDGPVAKAYGAKAGPKIWASVPNEKDKREVIIPDRYEDEPDHG